ncbi:MAG: hypothetical protein ABEL51_08105, partial [Salinibacter sp.]
MTSAEDQPRRRMSPWLTGSLAAAIVLVVAATSFYGGYRLGSDDGGSEYQQRIVGAWKQGGSQGNVAFQFFPDGSVAVARLSPEGAQVRFRGLYEIVEENTLLLDLVGANPPEGEARVEKTYAPTTPPQQFRIDTPGLTAM